jgi:hypothetical protein
MVKIRHAYKILVRPTGRCRWKENFKMDLGKIGCESVMNLRFHNKEFLDQLNGQHLPKADHVVSLILTGRNMNCLEVFDCSQLVYLCIQAAYMKMDVGILNFLPCNFPLHE